MSKKITCLWLLPLIPALAEQPKFEIADVHPSTTLRAYVQSFGGVVHEGRYINREATMLALIKAAYGVSDDDIAGGPGWISYDLFDVIAKVPEGTTAETANLMLQSLLSERFGLVVRRDTRPVPRYILTVGKNGSKLKPADPSETTGCRPLSQPGPPPADISATPNIKVACRSLTGAAIAENLRQMAGGYLDHDVVDSTGLEGSWDFDLEWTPRGALTAKGGDGISVFMAVEKQLGLKLEQQNVPMPALFVERVNRRPTPNPDGIATSLAVAAARFEVASIKPANPNDRPFTGMLYTGGSQIHAGGTLRELIAMALQVSPNVASDVFIGLPKSADSNHWDIIAKIPATGEGAVNIVRGRPTPPPFSVACEMLRGFLLDQFELKTHPETREVTVYALTLAGGKPKMTRADDSERSGCKPDANAPKPVANMGAMISCKNTRMADLAQDLQMMAGAYMDHPVFDATGLDGGWNFLMGWTPKAQLQKKAQQSDPNQQPGPNQQTGQIPQAADPDGITAFEAVERELGLKLVKQKRIIPVIVVDHVDEKPIE
jgi:uncharacterized protein (TIGR03435 family)